MKPISTKKFTPSIISRRFNEVQTLFKIYMMLFNYLNIPRSYKQLIFSQKLKIKKCNNILRSGWDKYILSVSGVT